MKIFENKALVNEAPVKKIPNYPFNPHIPDCMLKCCYTEDYTLSSS